jgi:hypothetical protein
MAAGLHGPKVTVVLPSSSLLRWQIPLRSAPQFGVHPSTKLGRLGSAEPERILVQTGLFTTNLTAAISIYTEDVGGSIPSPPTIVSRQGKVHLKPSGVVMAGVAYGRP